MENIETLKSLLLVCSEYIEEFSKGEVTEERAAEICGFIFDAAEEAVKDCE